MRQRAFKHKKSYWFIRWKIQIKRTMVCMTFPGQSVLFTPDTAAIAGQGNYAMKVQLGELMCLLEVLKGT